MILPLETLPSGDPSGVVVYLCIVLSSEEASHFMGNFNIFFLWRGVVSTLSNPQAGGPPLVVCPRLLIQFIHSYPPYWRLFLLLQPEDAPCHGDGPTFEDLTILLGLFAQNHNCPLLALGLFCRIHSYQLDAHYSVGSVEG
jgi:hypothetical protein